MSTLKETPLYGLDRRLDVLRTARGDVHPSWTPSAGGVHAWGALTLVFGVFVIFVVQFSRYPEWDEAVFLSQSGGFEGVNSEPSYLVASRERGTPVVIGLLRLLAPSLANTRMLWMGLAMAILIVSIVQISRLLRFPAVLPASLVSGYWLTFAFASSFFSFFVAGCCMLLASSFYFRIRHSVQHQWANGIYLGLALAAALWFRQIESALFSVLLLAHSVLVTPRQFWSKRWRAALAAVPTVIMTFILPWVIDSTARFGSVGDRITSGRSQSFERGLTSHVLEYLATLGGFSQKYGDLATPPVWATFILSLLLIGIFALAAGGALRRHKSRRSWKDYDVRLGARGFLWAVGALLMGFFMFFIGDVSDRYMVIGSIFLLVAATATAWPVLERWAQSANGLLHYRRMPAIIAGVVLVWFATNAVVARSYETARFMAGTATERNVAVIRGLAEGEGCLGVSRYGAPQVEFGTGCDVRSAASPADVRRIFADEASTDGFTFILWPAKDVEAVRDILGPSHLTLLLPSFEGQQDLRLVYSSPDDPV